MQEILLRLDLALQNKLGHLLHESRNVFDELGFGDDEASDVEAFTEDLGRVLSPVSLMVEVRMGY